MLNLKNFNCSMNSCDFVLSVDFIDVYVHLTKIYLPTPSRLLLCFLSIFSAIRRIIADLNLRRYAVRNLVRMEYLGRNFAVSVY